MSRLVMPGAASAVATTGIRLRASNAPRKPSTATGINGTPLPIGVWYQPLLAITALAVNQPPMTTAAPPASSAARRRPTPARAAPP
jgi:hypothetical protein